MAGGEHRVCLPVIHPLERILRSSGLCLSGGRLSGELIQQLRYAGVNAGQDGADEQVQVLVDIVSVKVRPEEGRIISQYIGK